MSVSDVSDPSETTVTDQELIDQYLDLQECLAKFGVTSFTIGLDVALKSKLMRLRGLEDPYTELEPALDRLHEEAYPSVKRPPRLVAAVMPDPRM
jgi:hypothetical protein